MAAYDWDAVHVTLGTVVHFEYELLPKTQCVCSKRWNI